MNQKWLDALVTQLRDHGGDTNDVEVKSAQHGMPSSLASTLCAFANRPDGGTLILGLDESQGFRAVKIDDPHQLAQKITSLARNKFEPPIHVDVFADAQVDDTPVVVARIHEYPQEHKPCREKFSRKAYIRAYDGDYVMSPLEEQGYLAARRVPNADTQPVAGATLEDLDPDSVNEWHRMVRRLDRDGLGRFDDEQRLVRAGACTADLVPTVAGLLAFGVYPQQFLPGCVIHLASIPLGQPPDLADADRIRAIGDTTLTGNLPLMLQRAMTWATTYFVRASVQQADGHVINRWEYPLAAFREIMSNALIHRDYSQWALGSPIEVRRKHDRLAVTSPGGLYGLTTSQLGTRPLTSARNLVLLSLCKYVELPDENRRLIEALAQGIPTVTRELQAAKLPAATYDDTGISFTVILRNSMSNSAEDRATRQRLADGHAEVVSTEWRSVEPVPSEVAVQGHAGWQPDAPRRTGSLASTEVGDLSATPDDLSGIESGAEVSPPTESVDAADLGLSTRQRQIMNLMDSIPSTVEQIATQANLTEGNVRRILDDLLRKRLVTVDRGSGRRPHRYSRAPL